MIWLSRLSFFFAVLDLVLMIYLIVNGFPPEALGKVMHFKNMRKPFLALLFLCLVAVGLHPERKSLADRLKKKVTSLTAKPYAIWLLFMIYSLLFLWQQLTEYFSIDINFLPFSFYDYMFHYFFQGKINFTGLLHGYYHLNNIMIFLVPFWYFFRSSLFLVVIYGFIAAAAVLPLYGIAKERFQSPLLAFFIAFIYLNYRYLQNVLLMNFSVEIFYPLFIFASVYTAMKERWKLYYLFVFLGLFVKEDSFLYFSAVGLLVFFMKHQVLFLQGPNQVWTKADRGGMSIPKRKLHGFLTIVFSLVYFVFLIKFFIPWTGNTILKGDIENFGGFGESIGDMLGNLLRSPWLIIAVLFGTAEKWRTYFNLLGRLLFLPVCSPSALLILAPLLPLFFHSTGRDSDFIDLRFHYAAAVIPFVFLAFIFGFSNVRKKIPERWRQIFMGVASLALLAINGGNYVTRPITQENIRSIQWAQRIPARANLVTHGHLLPYVGYRKYNYYFAVPFELKEHPAHEAFSKADYYLLDFNVNLYPMNKAYVEQKVKALKEDSSYQLVDEEDERYLFVRKDFHIGRV